MPTYEYLCPNGHRFDRFQKMSDPPVAACPKCGEDGERQISAGAGFLFKGDGFYITDYRDKDYKSKAKAESGGTGGEGSPGAGSTKKSSSTESSPKKSPGSGGSSGGGSESAKTPSSGGKKN